MKFSYKKRSEKNLVASKLKNKKIESRGVWSFLCGLGKNIPNKIMTGKSKNRLKSRLLLRKY